MLEIKNSLELKIFEIIAITEFLVQMHLKIFTT